MHPIAAPTARDRSLPPRHLDFAAARLRPVRTVGTSSWRIDRIVVPLRTGIQLAFY
jgi:hypothetical protein